MADITVHAVQFTGQEIPGTTRQHVGLMPDGSPDVRLLVVGDDYHFTVKQGDWVLTYSDGSRGVMSPAQYAAMYGSVFHTVKHVRSKGKQ